MQFARSRCRINAPDAVLLWLMGVAVNAGDGRKPTAFDYKQLVNSLVSPNPPPVITTEVQEKSDWGLSIQRPPGHD